MEKWKNEIRKCSKRFSCKVANSELVKPYKNIQSVMQSNTLVSKFRNHFKDHGILFSTSDYGVSYHSSFENAFHSNQFLICGRKIEGKLLPTKRRYFLINFSRSVVLKMCVTVVASWRRVNYTKKMFPMLMTLTQTSNLPMKNEISQKNENCGKRWISFHIGVETPYTGTERTLFPQTKTELGTIACAPLNVKCLLHGVEY